MYFLPSQCRTMVCLAFIGVLPATFLFSSCAVTDSLKPEAIETRPLSSYESPWELDIPSDTGQSASFFSIPEGEVSDLLFSRSNLPRAREIISSGLTRAVRLHRLGDRLWLSAEMPPSTVWPMLKQYFADRSISLEEEDPSQGILQSGLNRDSTPAVAYRIRVESGLRSGSAEIHLQLMDGTGQQVVNSELTIARFRDMLDFISRTVEVASSMLVQHLDFTTKMTTSTDERGFPQIEIRTDTQRAWALLTAAARKLELQIVGSDSRRRLIEFDYRQQITRQTVWQPRWPAGAWQSKAGLSPLRPQYRPNTRLGVRPDGNLSSLERVYLRLDFKDGKSIIRLINHNLSINTAFELMSRLVQEIQ